LQEFDLWTDVETRGTRIAGIAILKFTSKSGEKGFQSADVAGAE
jgi:hypothetical protein